MALSATITAVTFGGADGKRTIRAGLFAQ